MTGDQATAARKYYAALPVLQRHGPKLDLASRLYRLAFIFRYQRQFDDARSTKRPISWAKSLAIPTSLIGSLRGRLAS